MTLLPSALFRQTFGEMASVVPPCGLSASTPCSRIPSSWDPCSRAPGQRHIQPDYLRWLEQLAVSPGLVFAPDPFGLHAGCWLSLPLLRNPPLIIFFHLFHRFVYLDESALGQALPDECRLADLYMFTFSLPLPESRLSGTVMLNMAKPRVPNPPFTPA